MIESIRASRVRVWIWHPDGTRTQVLTDDLRSWTRRPAGSSPNATPEPCPLKVPCGPRECAIGQAAGSETYA